MTADRFRRALAELEMTETEFARRCGIHVTTLSRQLSADRIPLWAGWIITLLLERREIAERLSDS